jgi:pimeloyl-ACP methyl ester carboxylesterase
VPQAEGFHFEEYGGGAPAPPLVFIHGAGGNRLHWPPGLRRLPEAHTYALDLPGHGKSPGSEERTIDELAERLLAWRRGLRLRGAVLAGHSMGAAIALTAAIGEPQSFAGLVLIGAGARLQVNPTLLQQTGHLETFPAAVEQILDWSFASQAEPRLVAQARRRLVDAGPAVLHRDLAACDGFNISGRLAEVRQPTLIIVGGQDRMTPPRLSEALQQGISGSRLETVEGAGHMVMLERPEAVAALLLGFLGEIRETS